MPVLPRGFCEYSGPVRLACLYNRFGVAFVPATRGKKHAETVEKQGHAWSVKPFFVEIPPKTGDAPEGNVANVLPARPLSFTLCVLIPATIRFC
jgi:hypothetical protein